MKVWMNMYAQGWYHRVGKPGTLNLHPGDLYATEAAALADIDDNAPYICTVSAELPSLVGVIEYDPESTPVSMALTRKWFSGDVVPPQAIPTRRRTEAPSFGDPDSLEHGDA